MQLLEEWRVYHRVYSHSLLTFPKRGKVGYLNKVALQKLPQPCYYKVNIQNGEIKLSFSPFSRKGFSLFKGRISTNTIFLQKSEYLLSGNWRNPSIKNISKKCKFEFS